MMSQNRAFLSIGPKLDEKHACLLYIYLLPSLQGNGPRSALLLKVEDKKPNLLGSSLSYRIRVINEAHRGSQRALSLP